MSDEAALLQAIIAHADDDTPRLVYADWLDEHDDPDRAEFIRVQCRLAEMSPAEQDWVDLTEREAELISRLRGKIAASPTQSRDLSAYRRGFPFSVVYDASYERWTDQEVQRATELISQLVASTTVRGVSLNAVPQEQFVKMATGRAFDDIQQLIFSFANIWEQETAVIAFQQLAAPSTCRNLRQLSVQTTVWPGAVDCLAAGDAFPNLRRLWLPYIRVPAGEVRRLLAANWVQRLGELHLTLWNREVVEPLLTGAGHLPELYTLELSQMPADAVGSLSAGRFPRLASLACPDARIKLRGLQELLDSSWFARLRVLNLSSNELGDRAAVALASHPVARSLRILQIGNNPFGKTGLLALAKPGAFPELVWLDLSLANDTKRKATESDLTAFLSRLALPQLRRLSLKRLPVGDSGAKAIATNTAFAGLRDLVLGEGVTEKGTRALRAARHLQQTRIV